MARTTIPIEQAPGAAPLAENVLAWTNADTVNGNQFTHTGREILLVWNSSTTAARNVTLQSVAINGRQDPKHNTAQSVPIGEYRVYGPFGEGWKQTDGNVYVNGDNAELRFLVIRMP